MNFAAEDERPGPLVALTLLGSRPAFPEALLFSPLEPQLQVVWISLDTSLVAVGAMFLAMTCCQS